MEQITIAEYLVQQLNKLNVTDVFGVPGDFNFSILEAIINSSTTKWIGCTNELNAGYATDGYAREKGFGAIVTTFGVGELSAINAIAGCMAENVPVMLIVGIPATKNIDNNVLIHHNLVSADYRVYQKTYANVVETTAFLNKENAKTEIDRLINIMVRTKRPVYVAIPTDVAKIEIENVDCDITMPKSDLKNLELITDKIAEMLAGSQTPMVIADCLTKKFGAKEGLNEFLQKTNIPSTCFVRGMDIIHSNTKNYLGTYAGHYDNEICYEYLKKSDCILGCGCVISDLNTMIFDLPFDKNKFIDINSDYTIVNGLKYENVLIKDLFDLLSKKIKYKYNKHFERSFAYQKAHIEKEEKLNCGYFYPRINEFLKDGDIFVTEVCFPAMGTVPMKLPDNISVHNQMLWGSIGWGTGAALGCSVAQKNNRVILITGDGAHQLTASEISTVMKLGLKPIIFVINNGGYTIERLLCDDPDYEYNDIAKWNFVELPKIFDGECFTAQVRTNIELDNILKELETVNNAKMCYIELFLDKMDMPELVKKMFK